MLPHSKHENQRNTKKIDSSNRKNEKSLQGNEWQREEPWAREIHVVTVRAPSPLPLALQRHFCRRGTTTCVPRAAPLWRYHFHLTHSQSRYSPARCQSPQRAMPTCVRRKWLRREWRRALKGNNSEGNDYVRPKEMTQRGMTMCVSGEWRRAFLELARYRS